MQGTLPWSVSPEFEDALALATQRHQTQHLMKTRVAVRDKTPHRFQVVPLRDRPPPAKQSQPRHNLPALWTRQVAQRPSGIGLGLNIPIPLPDALCAPTPERLRLRTKDRLVGTPPNHSPEKKENVVGAANSTSTSDILTPTPTKRRRPPYVPTHSRARHVVDLDVFGHSRNESDGDKTILGFPSANANRPTEAQGAAGKTPASDTVATDTAADTININATLQATREPYASPQTVIYTYNKSSSLCAPTTATSSISAPFVPTSSSGPASASRSSPTTRTHHGRSISAVSLSSPACDSAPTNAKAKHNRSRSLWTAQPQVDPAPTPDSAVPRVRCRKRTNTLSADPVVCRPREGNSDEDGKGGPGINRSALADLQIDSTAQSKRYGVYTPRLDFALSEGLSAAAIAGPDAQELAFDGHTIVASITQDADLATHITDAQDALRTPLALLDALLATYATQDSLASVYSQDSFEYVEAAMLGKGDYTLSSDAGIVMINAPASNGFTDIRRSSGTRPLQVQVQRPHRRGGSDAPNCGRRPHSIVLGLLRDVDRAIGEWV
ncbi:hypothetical protein C8J57DRAFT_1498269 [Mycena rebaudengoi]|nr:hypothetical protein C8J57DRAFT_1498269 [Mycena rebaudengoi]